MTRDEFSSVLHRRPAISYERSFDVHVSHLRRKLQNTGVVIQCERREGYTLLAGAVE